MMAIELTRTSRILILLLGIFALGFVGFGVFHLSSIAFGLNAAERNWGTVNIALSPLLVLPFFLIWAWWRRPTWPVLCDCSVGIFGWVYFPLAVAIGFLCIDYWSFGWIAAACVGGTLCAVTYVPSYLVYRRVREWTACQ